MKGLLKFAAWMIPATVVGALCIVGLAALAFALPVRTLLIPFLLLTVGQLPALLLLYWAQIERARPDIYRKRIGVTVLVYTEGVSIATILSGASVGLIARSDLSWGLPFIAIGAAVGAWLANRRSAR